MPGLLYNMKESCWTSQLACNVCLRKIKNICCLSNWIQRSIEKNAGSGERRAELRRNTTRLQSIITSAGREVKYSRRSGMSQSCFFWDKIGHAMSVGFLLFDEMRAELV